MKYLFSILCLIVLIERASPQLKCDSTKAGKMYIHWCYDSEIRSINPDSLAKAHLKLKRDAFYIIVPNDSLIRSKTMILTSNKIFSGKNSTILGSYSQSKRRRSFIYMNSDL